MRAYFKTIRSSSWDASVFDIGIKDNSQTISKTG